MCFLKYTNLMIEKSSMLMFDKSNKNQIVDNIPMYNMYLSLIRAIIYL